AAQEHLLIAERDICERWQLLVLQLEAETLRVEGNGPGNIFHLVSNAVNTLDERTGMRRRGGVWHSLPFLTSGCPARRRSATPGMVQLGPSLRRGTAGPPLNWLSSTGPSRVPDQLNVYASELAVRPPRRPRKAEPTIEASHRSASEGMRVSLKFL